MKTGDRTDPKVSDGNPVAHPTHQEKPLMCTGIMLDHLPRAMPPRATLPTGNMYK